MVSWKGEDKMADLGDSHPISGNLQMVKWGNLSFSWWEFAETVILWFCCWVVVLLPNERTRIWGIYASPLFNLVEHRLTEGTGKARSSRSSWRSLRLAKITDEQWSVKLRCSSFESFEKTFDLENAYLNQKIQVSDLSWTSTLPKIQKNTRCAASLFRCSPG